MGKHMRKYTVFTHQKEKKNRQHCFLQQHQPWIWLGLIIRCWSPLLTWRWFDTSNYVNKILKTCGWIKLTTTKICPVLTNTVAESGRERDVSIRRPPRWILRQEAFRSKLLRLRKVPWVTMESVGDDDGIGSFGHLKTIYGDKNGEMESHLEKYLFLHKYLIVILSINCM